jgi:hypothetical protein
VELWTVALCKSPAQNGISNSKVLLGEGPFEGVRTIASVAVAQNGTSIKGHLIVPFSCREARNRTDCARVGASPSFIALADPGISASKRRKCVAVDWSGLEVRHVGPTGGADVGDLIQDRVVHDVRVGP